MWASASTGMPTPREEARRGGHLAGRVPQESDAEGLQVLCLADDSALRAGRHRIVGPTARANRTSVDALAWVMGEQGAKNARRRGVGRRHLRGTSSCPAGRAEATVTIDNSDSALPIRVLRGVDHPAEMLRNSAASTKSTAAVGRFDGCPGAAEQAPHRPEKWRHRGAGQARRDPRANQRIGGRSSRKPPACSSTASARRRPSANSRPCRRTSPGSPT